MNVAHVALRYCRERMFSIRSIFEVCGVRVDGYMGGVSPTGGFSAVDVAVCTIEKANTLINRLIDEKKMAELGESLCLNSKLILKI